MRVHRLVLSIVVAGAAAGAAITVHAQQVLRAGAYLVQVDAYPTRDGVPMRGLTAADFELLEDGKPQTIESVRFIEFPLWTPEQQRRDPSSQRESYELAGSPSSRLFVVYLNRIRWQDGNYVEPALIDFLDRTIGPNDYVAVMTALQAPSDLVFGQVTTAFKSEAKRFLDVIDWMDPGYFTPPELELFTCFPGDEGKALIERWRVDDTYRDLEGVLSLLGSIRETRSTLIFVSDGMVDPRTNTGLTRPPAQRPGISGPSTLMPPPSARGTFQVPGTQLTRGRCEDMKRAALEPWSPHRFRELLTRARVANVAVNPINPRGLIADANSAVTRAAETVNDLMRTMATETGGLAIVNLNDMHAAFRQVADSMTAHYVLSYYSTNKAQDGNVRRLTVRLKSTGDTLRARREYRAPDASDAVTTATSPPPPVAPAVLAVRQALAELEAAERAGDDRRAPAQPPAFFRAPSPPAAPWQPTTQRRFARTERLRLEWQRTDDGPIPVAVRLLNRDGQPVAATFTLTRSDDGRALYASMALAPLAAAPYIVEAELADGTFSYVAFRVG